MDAVHIMMDLETWGVRPGSAIRSVGCVEFGPAGLGREFYRNIEDQSCLDVGLVRDPDTVQWWTEQSDEAQVAFADDPRPLPQAVSELESWVCDVTALLPEQPIHCWAHGASFDPVLWGAACHAVGMSLPFKFWDLRDTRTLYALTGVDLPRFRSGGTHHNALDDAKAQARAAIAAYQILGLWPTNAKGVSAHG